MLIRFWVSNYRCFRDKAELDFTDKKNYWFGKECVRGDFLEKIVMLGNNGSGKTSFGYAILDIIGTVTGFSKDIGQNDPDCFINGYGDSDRATFHYEFYHRGMVIEYEYTKTSPDAIVRERLAVNCSTVFDYDLSDPDASLFRLESVGADRLDVSRINGSVSLVRMMSDVCRFDADSPVRVVADFAKHSVYYRAMWKLDEHIGVIDDEDDIEKYVVENNLVGDLTEFLRDRCHIDLSLACSGDRLVVRTSGKDLPFFSTVSRGTVLLCRLYCWNRRSSGMDALMFFDDFDDLFDYRTAEEVMTHIIRSSVAQCIFVTHNVGLISSDSLRPDCCFLIRDGGLRSLSSLTDKNIRRGNNLEKMMRDGQFYLQFR